MNTPTALKLCDDIREMERRTFKALPVKMFDKFSYISFALNEFRIFKPSVFPDSCFLRNRSSREEMTSREI